MGRGGDAVSTLEGISIQNMNPVLSVSLRGSLADDYYHLTYVDNTQEANHFIKSLLVSNDGNLIRYREGEQIVIGLLSEKGKYFPHW